MYSVLYDNTARQYCAIPTKEAEGFMRYLNMQEIATGIKNKKNAFETIQWLIERDNEHYRDHIKSFNIKKGAIKSIYDKCMWSDQEYFEQILIGLDFKFKMNKNYKEAFGTQLAATSYMRRLFWYMFDDASRSNEQIEVIKQVTENLMESMCSRQLPVLWKILSQFVDIMVLINDKTDIESLRSNTVRNLIIENNSNNHKEGAR